MITRRPHPTHWLSQLRKAAALVLAVRGRPRRVVVSGESMRPTLAPGDRLVVVPTARLRLGEVVAVADPRESGRLLVKRIGALRDGQVELRGDNPAASTDSRQFGGVPRNQVVGTALYRYYPPKRAGWLCE